MDATGGRCRRGSQTAPTCLCQFILLMSWAKQPQVRSAVVPFLDNHLVNNQKSSRMKGLKMAVCLGRSCV